MILAAGPLRTAVMILASVFGLYVLMNVVRSRDAGGTTDVATEATSRTIGGMSAVLIGAATVFAVLGAELSNFLGMIGELIAMFPEAIGQLGLLVLGGLGVSGMIPLSGVQFVIAGVGVLAFVAVVRR